MTKLDTKLSSKKLNKAKIMAVTPYQNKFDTGQVKHKNKNGRNQA